MPAARSVRAVAALLGPAALLVSACGASTSTAPSTSSTPSTAATSSSPAATPTPTVSASATPTPTASVSTAGFNSCSVVTQAQAAAALGTSVTAGVPGTATVEGGKACVFYGPASPAPHDPNVAQPDSVRVVVVKGSDATTWFHDYRSKVAAVSEAGLGSQAYWDGYASLSVLTSDGSYLRVAVAPAGAAPSLAAEKQLATAILPAL